MTETTPLVEDLVERLEKYAGDWRLRAGSATEVVDAIQALRSLSADKERLEKLLALSPADQHQVQTLPDNAFVISKDDWSIEPYLSYGWVSKLEERTYGRRLCAVYQITEEGRRARTALGGQGDG